MCVRIGSPSTSHQHNLLTRTHKHAQSLRYFRRQPAFAYHNGDARTHDYSRFGLVYCYGACFEDDLCTAIIEQIARSNPRPEYIIWIVRNIDPTNEDDDYDPDESKWLQAAKDAGYKQRKCFQVLDTEDAPAANRLQEDADSMLCYVLKDASPPTTTTTTTTTTATTTTTTATTATTATAATATTATATATATASSAGVGTSPPSVTTRSQKRRLDQALYLTHKMNTYLPSFS